MPAVRPGLVVEVPATAFDLGKSDTSSAKGLYPTSPLFDGSYSSDNAVRTAFLRPVELMGTQLNDGGYAYGLVERFYKDTPNLAEVVLGGAGLPGSPYAPNIGTPSDGQNPASIPTSGITATENLRSRSNGAFIGNGLVSPNTTVAAVVDPTTRGLGIGSGNSFKVRIM